MLDFSKLVGKCHPSLRPTPLRAALPVGGRGEETAREDKAQRINSPYWPSTHRNPSKVIFGTYMFSREKYFHARCVKVSWRGESAN